MGNTSVSKLYPARLHYTYSTAQLLDANAIKTAIATDNAAANTYSGAALNGVLANPGPAIMRFPQAFYIVTSVSVGAYNTTDPIIVAGTNWESDTVTESLTLANANGNETKVGNVGFKTVTSIYVPIQLTGAGQFEFGVRDVVFDCAEVARQIRHGSDGNILVGFAGGTTDTVAGVTAERHDAFYRRIYGTATTTSTSVTIYV